MKDTEKLTQQEQMNINVDTSLIINKDRLYELIKTMKEIKRMLPKDTLSDYSTRYHAARTIETLNNLLKKKGIDTWLVEQKDKKRQLEFQLHIKDLDQEDEE